MITPKELFALLSDETRLRCMLLLNKKEEICVCEFCEVLKSTQPKISRHLAYLRKSGVVLDQRREQWVYYRLNHSLAIWIKQILSKILNVLKNEEPYKSDFEKLNRLRKKHNC